MPAKGVPATEIKHFEPEEVVVKQLTGRNALVTGASGGIGAEIARRLAGQGMHVAISGRREQALTQLSTELGERGVKCVSVTADLGEREQLRGLLGEVEAQLGPVDVLVNNAGIEAISSFTAASEQALSQMIEVNLTAPMLLTHAAVPGMLARGRGHVVFISSLAGKFGPAYNEPYAASKAGLIALTQSLRAEYAGRPVGFSVVCPGFTTGEGMYQRMADQGHTSNRLVGETSTKKVADAVLKAIRDDVGEIVESGAPIRPMLALQQLAPRVVERIAPRFGVDEMFARVAESRGQR
jgi:short-subunit dehydrogenase